MPEYESEYMRGRGHLCKKSCQGMGKEFVAGEIIVTGYFVMFSGADDITVINCTAAGPLIGIAMNDAAVGDVVAVAMDGYHWISVGTAGAIIPGDWVASDANGQAVEYVCPTAGNETTLGGLVLTTPTEDDDCICLKVQPVRLCTPGA